jgi:hypothetical protein
MAKIPLPKSIKDLCTPSSIYFVISMIAIILLGIQNIGNNNMYCAGSYKCGVTNTMFVFVLKVLYVLFWTWILDLICKAGYTNFSWFLLLLPIMLLFVLIGLMLINGDKMLV